MYDMSKLFKRVLGKKQSTCTCLEEELLNTYTDIQQLFQGRVKPIQIRKAGWMRRAFRITGFYIIFKGHGK